MTTIVGPIVSCGVEGHGPECLCDVVLHDECVEVMEDLMRMWGAPFSRGGTMSLLDRLELVTKAHDIWMGERFGGSDDGPQGSEEQLERLRFALKNGVHVDRALLQEGLGVPDFVALVKKPNNNTPTKLNEWTLLDVIECERVVRTTESVKTVMDVFGLDNAVAKRILAVFGVEPKVESDFRKKLTDAQREQVLQWALEPELSHAQVVRRCWNEFGVQITRSYVSMMRTKHYKSLGQKAAKVATVTTIGIAVLTAAMPFATAASAAVN